jgi:hypothetical protein
VGFVSAPRFYFTQNIKNTQRVSKALQLLWCSIVQIPLSPPKRRNPVTVVATGFFLYLQWFALFLDLSPIKL